MRFNAPAPAREHHCAVQDIANADADAYTASVASHGLVDESEQPCGPRMPAASAALRPAVAQDSRQGQPAGAQPAAASQEGLQRGTDASGTDARAPAGADMLRAPELGPPAGQARPVPVNQSAGRIGAGSTSGHAAAQDDAGAGQRSSQDAIASGGAGLATRNNSSAAGLQQRADGQNGWPSGLTDTINPPVAPPAESSTASAPTPVAAAPEPQAPLAATPESSPEKAHPATQDASALRAADSSANGIVDDISALAPARTASPVLPESAHSVTSRVRSASRGRSLHAAGASADVSSSNGFAASGAHDGCHTGEASATPVASGGLAPRPAPPGGWSPPPAVSTGLRGGGGDGVRSSLHVLPSTGVPSPTSSVGASSIFSRNADVYYARSLHALPRGGGAAASSGAFGSNAALAERVRADQAARGGGSQSPSASVTSLASSVRRRRARASLHALPPTHEGASAALQTR